MNSIDFGGGSGYIAFWFVIFTIWVAWNFFSKKRKVSFLEVEFYLFYILVFFLIGFAILLFFKK